MCILRITYSQGALSILNLSLRIPLVCISNLFTNRVRITSLGITRISQQTNLIITTIPSHTTNRIKSSRDHLTGAPCRMEERQWVLRVWDPFIKEGLSSTQVRGALQVWPKELMRVITIPFSRDRYHFRGTRAWLHLSSISPLLSQCIPLTLRHMSGVWYR